MTEVLEGRPEPYQPRWRASLGQVLRGRTFVAVQRNDDGGEPARAEADRARDRREGRDRRRLHGRAFDRVVGGSADVLFGDRAILLDAARRSPAAGGTMVLDRHFTYDAPALALRRSDEDFRLAVDRALSALYPLGRDRGDLHGVLRQAQ